jgi:hypothetical protein
MIAVAGLALALLVLALVSRGHGSTSEQIVRGVAAEKDPRVVAAAAEVLEARGMKLTAEALRARAQALSSGAVTGEGNAPIESPAQQVPTQAWTRFVRTLGGTPLDFRSPSGRLGLFSIHLHRLAELGHVRDLHRITSGALAADWVEPEAEAAFLASPRLQYEVLVESLSGLADEIAGRPFPIGRHVDGRRTSLSGLLAVAHRLGIAGLERWVASGPERARQRIATAMFERANGIF